MPLVFLTTSRRKDQSLTDTDALPAPDVLATEIADELGAAFDLFSKIAAKLPKSI